MVFVSSLKVRKLVLDVVKPQEPNIIEYSRKLSDVTGVDGVNVSLIEIDKRVENVRVTVKGKEIDVSGIMDTIESLGGAVHSIDEVATGHEIIEHARTLEES